MAVSGVCYIVLPANTLAASHFARHELARSGLCRCSAVQWCLLLQLGQEDIRRTCGVRAEARLGSVSLKEDQTRMSVDAQE